MTDEAFKKKCNRVAESLGIGVEFYSDDGFERQFEDDGTLHISRANVRACFDVSGGEGKTAKDQNDLTRDVMKALRMTKYIGDSVLVDEDDEADEVCPHCGRTL